MLRPVATEITLDRDGDPIFAMFYVRMPFFSPLLLKNHFRPRVLQQQKTFFPSQIQS